MGWLSFRSIKCGLTVCATALVVMAMAGLCSALGQTPTAQTDPSMQRAVGSIQAITDNGITLASDSGEQIKVTLQDSARTLRVAPGAKDLKNATPVQKHAPQVGERIAVRGVRGAHTHPT